jgi:hypothetical protein
VVLISQWIGVHQGHNLNFKTKQGNSNIMKNELNFGLSLFPPKQKCEGWIHMVGGPIFVKNNRREQKKDKINVCSILVNYIYIYPSSND